MKSICLVLALFGACALASDDYSNYNGAYHGKYGGKCQADGFYYKDSGSFVICSNNNAYEQPCAPGSQNSGYGNYVSGNSYGYRDFCDVNLVDYGYGANSGYGAKGGYGDARRGSYGGYNRGYGGYDGGYGRYDGGYNRGYGRYDGGYGRYDGGYGGYNGGYGRGFGYGGRVFGRGH